MPKVFREARRYIKKNKRQIEKEMVVDTFTITLIEALTQLRLFFFDMTLTQILVTGSTAVLLHFAIAGAQGQIMDWFRRRFRCEPKAKSR